MSESVKNGLNHILLIYNRSIVEFLGREQFINTLLDIIVYLYNNSIRVVSIFEPSGLIYRMIHDNIKYKLIKYGFSVHSFGDNSLTFSRQVFEDTNGTDSSESGLFISKMNYFHATSAHLELLGLCSSFKEVKKRAKKKIKKTKGKSHRIPPKKSIIQPFIANKLSISTPEIIICIHLSLVQILFTFKIPLVQRLYNLRSLIANATAPSKRYIYPFGPSGVPPWALSEAEIYQVFGTEPKLIEDCIRLFRQCNRRNGK